MSPRTLSSKPALAAAIALGAYSLAVAGVYWRQRDLLYRAPRKALSVDAPVGILPATATQPALMGWADGGQNAQSVIYFGGSSESIELRREAMAKAFPGHTRYFIPYRGFGPNRHLAMGEAGIKDDACRAFDFLARRHTQVDVVGRSLGTGVALHVASRREVRRTGLVTPYDSILEVARKRYRWLPVGAMLKDKFESWRDAIAVKSPMLAILAETDPVVPHLRWQRLQEHLTAPLEVALVEGSNHTNIMDLGKTWREMARFFTAPGLTDEARVAPSAPRGLRAGP